MRTVFHGDLARLGNELAKMCLRSGEAMRQATQALLTADLSLAERVLQGDAEVDAQRTLCEERAYTLLALQAPVAGDLRTVLAAVYCAEKIERMGDLAAHIADTARFTHPDHAVPTELEGEFTELGEISASMADRLSELIAVPAEGAFAELKHTDHTVNDLHAHVLSLITSTTWSHGPGMASNLALLARFYERFGDQAVSAAKRLDFAVTGTLPS